MCRLICENIQMYKWIFPVQRDVWSVPLTSFTILSIQTENQCHIWWWSKFQPAAQICPSPKLGPPHPLTYKESFMHYYHPGWTTLAPSAPASLRLPSRLQLVQNAAARSSTRSKKRDHITPHHPHPCILTLARWSCPYINLRTCNPLQHHQRPQLRPHATVWV